VRADARSPPLDSAGTGINSRFQLEYLILPRSGRASTRHSPLSPPPRRSRMTGTAMSRCAFGLLRRPGCRVGKLNLACSPTLSLPQFSCRQLAKVGSESGRRLYSVPRSRRAESEGFERTSGGDRAERWRRRSATIQHTVSVRFGL